MLLREIMQSLLVNLIEYNGEKLNHFNDNGFYITTKEIKKTPSIRYSKQKKEVVRKLLLSIIRINTGVQFTSHLPELQPEADIYNILLSAREELGKLKNNMRGTCDLIIDRYIDKLNAVFFKRSQELVDIPQRDSVG